jgi:predicted metal-dependent hydrolase
MRDVRAELQRGIELFNAGAWFEAHEAWEEVWMKCGRGERLFVQALIHCAVARHHARLGNYEGAARQAEKGARKLAGYLPERHGVDTGRLYSDVQEWLAGWRRGEAAAGRATIGVKE